MTAAVAPSPSFVSTDRSGAGGWPLQLRTLAAALVAAFALDNVLLLSFLGHPPALVAVAAITGPAAMAALVYRSMPAQTSVSLSVVLASLVAAIVLLLLGGEGRLFFATEDWQVRDALLLDLGSSRWPFDYLLDGRSHILRAPIGMYLVPALLGGASQMGRDIALLSHNALVLTLIFAIGAALFATARARTLALVVFVFFSGFDILGAELADALGKPPNWDHIENWARISQFSSHITQIFWVPHHAFAGWTCALFYLLWRRGLANVGLFGASIPLVAIWSPLAILGAVPFALFAGVRSLLTKGWDRRDIAVCVLSTLISLPALIYLNINAAAVGNGPTPILLIVYLAVIALEVLPFVLPTLAEKSPHPDRATLVIVTACLLLMPLWRIGESSDFQMRASIMPLAVLAVVFAGWGARAASVPQKLYFTVALLLGSATGLTEIMRLHLAPSPPPLCSLQGVWNKQTQFVAAHATYFAPWDRFPPRLLPSQPMARAGSGDPEQCWARPWRSKRGVE